ncbi:MAG: HlyC/CorC family transporter [Rickettsiales bacterium]
MNPELLMIITIFILIILSAFFSSSETALTALSRAKIHKLVQKGNKKALYVHQLREKKENLLSTILIGNNLVNTLGSALATMIFINYFGQAGVIYATIIMTICLVIFAEILPKTYALFNAEKVSLFASSILRFVVKIFRPISIIIEYIVSFLLKMIGINQKSKEHDLISAIEELRGTIELHHKEGGVLKQDKDMLDSILDLAETEVSTVMTHRKNMFTVNASDTSNKILENISKAPYTRIPLWREEKDNIVGILHAKDVLKTTIYSTKKIKEIDFLKIAAKPWFIPETTTLREQLLAFKTRRNHFAIVVDEYGSVMGIITLEDILEEIVGDIKDEHDKGSVKTYKKIHEDTYIIDGDTTIRDINRDLDLELPEDDASTIAGLLIKACEKIPERGERFEFFNFEFTVLERYKNQITKLKLVTIAKITD